MAGTGDPLLRSLVAHLDGVGYSDPPNSSNPANFINARICLALDYGIVLRGTIVSPEWFAKLNDKEGGIDEGEEAGQSPGTPTWPPGFVYSLAEESRLEYVHLDRVEFLSGDTWVPGSTLRVPIYAATGVGERS